jgi:hypothetical protein
VHKFLRDLAVNVLANLIAAYIVYLIGVTIGVFPRYGAFISLMMVSVTGGGGNLAYASLLVSGMRGSSTGSAQRLRALGLGAVALGAITLLATFAAGDMLALWERLAYIASGAATILFGAGVAAGRQY